VEAGAAVVAEAEAAVAAVAAAGAAVDFGGCIHAIF